jgi:GH18 family chitinase
LELERKDVIEMAKSYSTSWQNPASGARANESIKTSTAIFNKYSWSIGFWFKPTSDQAVESTTLFQIYIDANNYWLMNSHSNGIPFFSICSDGSNITSYDASDLVMEVGNWYYLCAYGDTDTFGMTINGVLTTSGELSYDIPIGTLPTYMFLGCNANEQNQANGIYSDFIILPYKTNADQIYGYCTLNRPYYALPRMEVSGSIVGEIETAPLVCDGTIRDINVIEQPRRQLYKVGFELSETPGLLSVLTSAQEKKKLEEEAGQKTYMVIGYVNGSPIHAGVNPNLLTHIYYAFADIYPGTSDIWFNSAYGQYTSHVTAMVGLKATNPNLKAILSVGGWNCGGYGGGAGASGFEIAMSTAAHRANFAANCAYLVSAYALDGIDIDCEYPAPGSKTNFTLLMQAVRNAIGSSKFLGMTTPAGGATTYFDLATLANVVDVIGVMAYDMDQTGTKHHANLYVSGLSSVYSCETAINTHLTYVPASQLVLGMPFYGYIGLYSTRTYDQLVASYINKGGYTRFWDGTAKACYLKDSGGSFKVSYDDTVSLAEKNTYIKAQNLGGAMIWQLRQNSTQELLTTIYNGLR